MLRLHGGGLLCWANLFTSVNEILWFPIYDAAGNLIIHGARPLPRVHGLPKFLYPKDSDGIPFVPANVYGLAPGKPVIVCEGPIKAFACCQAGLAAVGLNGVWGAAVKNAEQLYVISAALQKALDWRGRKAYVAFDADWAIKPDVRHAMFRLFLILSVAGAELCQMTTWDVAQGNGIDDYLVNQLRSNGRAKAEDVLNGLMAQAKSFIDIVGKATIDLSIVSAEFKKVLIPKLLGDRLGKQLSKPLGVRPELLRELLTGPLNPKPDLSFAAKYQPWPDPVDAEKLLDDILSRIAKEALIGYSRSWWKK